MLSQFMRCLLLLCDNEMCREGVARSLLNCNREETDSGEGLDHFWVRDVEPLFNKKSEKLSLEPEATTGLSKVDVNAERPERDEVWLKDLVFNVKPHFSRFMHKYNRSGQNNPDMFKKIILDEEQSRRVVDVNAVDELSIDVDLLEDDEENNMRLSAMGKRCLATFNLCQIRKGDAQYPELYSFMQKEAARTDENGQVISCGREAGLDGFDNPTERRRYMQRRNSVGSCASTDQRSQVLQSVVTAINHATTSIEARERRREEARKGLLPTQMEIATDRQDRKEKRRMELSNQIAQVIENLDKNHDTKTGELLIAHKKNF